MRLLLVMLCALLLSSCRRDFEEAYVAAEAKVTTALVELTISDARLRGLKIDQAPKHRWRKSFLHDEELSGQLDFAATRDGRPVEVQVDWKEEPRDVIQLIVAYVIFPDKNFEAIWLSKEPPPQDPRP